MNHSHNLYQSLKFNKPSNIIINFNSRIKNIKVTKIKLKSFNGKLNIEFSTNDSQNIQEIINQYFYDYIPLLNSFITKEIELSVTFQGNDNSTLIKTSFIKIDYLKGKNFENLDQRERLICLKYLQKIGLL